MGFPLRKSGRILWEAPQRSEGHIGDSYLHLAWVYAKGIFQNVTGSCSSRSNEVRSPSKMHAYM